MHELHDRGQDDASARRDIPRSRPKGYASGRRPVCSRKDARWADAGARWADAGTDTGTRARSGIKAHHDPRLATDMAEVSLPFDAGRPHTWTAVWGDGETIIGCEGVIVRRIARAPDYPLALMIDIFEVDPADGPYPKSFVVHRVRGWSS